MFTVWSSFHAAAAAEPAVWVVRDDDSAVYLYGTFTALAEGEPWSTPVVDSLLGGVDAVWVDEDLSERGRAARSEAWAAACAEGAGWTSALTAARRRDVARVAAALRLTLAEVDQTAPWCTVESSYWRAIADAGMKPELSPGAWLYRAGAEQGLTVMSVDDIDAVLAPIRAGTLDDQVGMLLRLSVGMRGLGGVISGQARAWRAGDVESFTADTAMQSGGMPPAIFAAWRGDRTAAWRDHVLSRLDGVHDELVAVSLHHMVGRDGLLERLAEAGVRVERVDVGALGTR